jgi:hypothetical protein
LLPAVLLVFAVLPQLVHARTITVTSMGGWNASPDVVNGKWTGQPPAAPNHGKYYNCPNGQPGPCYFASDADANYDSYWTITSPGNASGFGVKPGSVSFYGPLLVWVVKTDWTDTKLTVHVRSAYTFTVMTSATMTITAADGTHTSLNIPVIGTIRTRGYGQCTWEAANKRWAQGGPTYVPQPGAYATTGSINAQYAPKQWDVIDFGTNHTSVISSPVTMTTTSNSDGTKTITYSFTIDEMNVKPVWGEQASTHPNSSLVIKVDKLGNKTISKGILSDYSTSQTATGYYR